MSSNSRSGYSPAEITSMQREAAERVREMQRRARQRVEQTNRMTIPPPEPSKPPAPPLPAPEPAPPFQGVVDRLNLDGETMLLLLLLLLLINEGGDRTLILALVYLLLG